jgi:hypothetical protein
VAFFWTVGYNVIEKYHVFRSSMETKISRLRAFIAAGKWVEALRIAAKFPDLGDISAKLQLPGLPTLTLVFIHKLVKTRPLFSKPELKP